MPLRSLWAVFCRFLTASRSLVFFNTVLGYREVSKSESKKVARATLNSLDDEPFEASLRPLGGSLVPLEVPLASFLKLFGSLLRPPWSDVVDR